MYKVMYEGDNQIQIHYIKVIVSRDFRGLQMILMGGPQYEFIVLLFSYRIVADKGFCLKTSIRGKCQDPVFPLRHTGTVKISG